MTGRTEQEIMRNWEGDRNTPFVSICTITYNHGKYITEAIDSFLMQETTFPFEIIIADDHSPDNTADIIQKYKKQYPNLIQTNLRKKNVGMITNFMECMQNAKGEYIALCEGDDFWIDPHKLQYQIDRMKVHPECLISFHPTQVVEKMTSSNNILSKHYEEETIISIEDIISGDGGFCPTASLVIQREVIDALPGFFINAPVGDYFLQVFASKYGGALYLEKVMSAYRLHGDGWTSKLKKDIEGYQNFISSFLIAIDKLDNLFKNEYHTEFMTMSTNQLIAILWQAQYPASERMSLYHQSVKLFSNTDRVTIDQEAISALLSHNEGITWLEGQVSNYQKTLERKEEGITWLEGQVSNYQKTLEGQLSNYQDILEEIDKEVLSLEKEVRYYKNLLIDKERQLAYKGTLKWFIRGSLSRVKKIIWGRS